MGPERHRRLLGVLVVSLVLLISSWVDDDDPSTDHNPTTRSSKPVSRRISKPVWEEDGGKKRKGDHGGYNTPTDEEEEEEEEGSGPSFAKSLKAKSRWYVKTPSFYFDLYSCLPRFICEVHAQASSTELTQLEKDVIGLFRNYVVLEGPGSPAYNYQLAAHMGQLATGLEPSPCHSLYSSCPLNRLQVIEVLRNVKSTKKIFS
ncbi:uncharacterized protein LOC121855420 isoform X2 [Homarus americanus]|uniref:Putative Overexpressor of cationic peroxidase 3-like n=1 Tax=Homarus americanus TaxID=6706 RepID=A0A8J5JAA5_HOMAM|nr:uncharacterized protein LOC121855420 isoform X2 [Homarus americanus]KAG7155132.1 putative Overexpressor of cationic peroxidase 3-like [Homarus americanus]